MVYQDLRLLTENRLANKIFAYLSNAQIKVFIGSPKKKQKSRLARLLLGSINPSADCSLPFSHVVGAEGCWMQPWANTDSRAKGGLRYAYGEEVGALEAIDLEILLGLDRRPSAAFAASLLCFLARRGFVLALLTRTSNRGFHGWCSPLAVRWHQGDVDYYWGLRLIFVAK